MSTATTIPEDIQCTQTHKHSGDEHTFKLLDSSAYIDDKDSSEQ